ncbi:DUF2938 domain-containing protein [Lysobacter sp. K5869]|uniref:DUF2938 domain-containing protein n=1 Tax=Lysobacter sp. K5869 TaxID=2820808 RepID=UPI001C05FE09|nr:DUF2938 domain-containing protein [Lysobacter sp. K5869]QWP75441.1 DUF2938 domain-containing protein [Lysobacter sp. K5869]
MNFTPELLLRGAAIGIGATVLIDLWALLQRRAFSVPTLDWALVGRWIGHFRHGRFVHAPIGASAPVRGERALGWLAHYAIGVAFGAALLALCGAAWARQPTLWPALAFGLATVAFPFLLMQPGLGAGLAAAKTPKPWLARRRSLITHGLFGLGLYLCAWLLAALMPR